MLMSVRGAIAATLLAGTALAATPALAQDESTSDITVSANVALTTEYRFRGVGLSDGDIAIQGGFDVSHSSGFYIGTWASSLDEDSVGFGSTEVDIYGGWTGEITSGLTADVGLLYYAYPNAPAGDYDYWEPYASLSGSVGPASLTVGMAYAWKQDSLFNQDNLYIYTDAEVAIPNTPVSITGHLGYTDGVLTFTNDGDALDWSIGASATIYGPLSVSVQYIGVGHSGPSIKGMTDDTVVATLSASF